MMAKRKLRECQQCFESKPLSKFHKDCDDEYLTICIECEKENKPVDEEERQDNEDYSEYHTKDGF